jgi:hypothetical protein
MKRFPLFSFIALVSMFLLSCGEPAKPTLTFDSSEYSIHSGDAVTVSGNPSGITYSFVESPAYPITLNASTGVIVYGQEVPASTQLLYQASYGAEKSSMVVVTLLQNVPAPTLSFSNLTNKITDGDFVVASSSTVSSVSYALKENVRGISVNASTGLVSFTQAVTDGATFNITASSNGAAIEKTFIAVTKNLVSSKNDTQIAEKEAAEPVAYFLDFSAAPLGTDRTLLGVMNETHILDEALYNFDAALSEVVISATYLQTLSVGEFTLRLVTARNNVSVSLIVATKMIETPEDLASINASRSALKGYYVQTTDIDLTSYLALGGAGYNEGKGWNPIGVYHDTIDGTAYSDSFQGIYDGDGHTIKGLSINRNDELAYNAGLFGYVYSTAVIKNLGVESSSTLNIRSYSGGLAGVNDGAISNCFSKVSLSNYSGSNVFKIIGSFVGRNGGTISCSYSTGSVNGDDVVGAFVGSNEGTISHCYALASVGVSSFEGGGLVSSDCEVFAEETAMKSFDFASVFSPVHWAFNQNDYPSLKSRIEFYFVQGISLDSIAKNYVRGDEIPLSASVKPSSLQAEYAPKIVYSVIGEGYSVVEGKLLTEYAVDLDFTVSASLEVEGRVYSSTASSHLYDRVSSVTLNPDNPTVVDAGQAYHLSAMILPTTADQTIEFSLVSFVPGVSISDGVLYVSEVVTATICAIRAKAGGVTSPSLSVTIRPLRSVVNQPIILSHTNIHDLAFTLPEGVSTEGLTARRENGTVDFTISGQTVTIASSAVTSVPNQLIAFTFTALDGFSYRGLAGYLDRAGYDESYVTTSHPSVVRLGSVEDFASYFNIFDYDSSRAENYGEDRIYLLTADIDFAHRKTYGIGYEGLPFRGTIYGNGHVIKNYGQGTSLAMDSEEYFTLAPEQLTSNYRSSLYNVGFFGVFGGKAFDLHFQDLEIKANNFVGGFAGTIESGAYVENVSLVSSQVANINDASFNATIEDHVAGFACVNNGSFAMVSYNGNTINLTQGDL